jgi:scyllo-inositol 2-dehydrogenase (NADP+)
MSLRAAAFLVFGVSLAATSAAQTPAPAPVRVAIAGTVHGHVTGFMRQIAGRSELTLVGVWEPDAALREAFRTRYSLPAEQMFATLDDLLARAKPEAVASFSSTRDHRPIVEAAAARGVHVMVEKPLAVSNADARAIEQAAAKGKIHVITNYETTWYPSHRAIWQLLKEQKAGGALRKIVVLDGHEGPKEINVQPEFMKWLGDPVENGAGALFDFGCYGANLMTWLMDGQRPLAISAVTQHFQPAVYPRVDDEATILVEYPNAQGIIQASWNWPVNRKDLEVYGERGYAIATGGNSLRVALPKKPEETLTPSPRPADERDSIAHLVAVARGARKPNALSSLENNIIVTEILVAARESARTHQRVTIAGSGRLP